MTDWKIYESQILEKIQNEFKGAKVLSNVKIRGHNSKVPRQIDILAKINASKYQLIVVVECKHFNKKIDVKIIESFIGFLEDVRANMGIMITNIGFTPAAQKRAKAKLIKLEIVEFKHFQNYSFDFDLCECGHEVLWENEMNAKINTCFGHILLGHCSYCDTLYFQCQTCNHIEEIHEGHYDEQFECACGKKYFVGSEYIGSGMNEDVVYLIGRRKMVAFVKSVKP